MNIDTIIEIEEEVLRFQKRIKAAKDRHEKESKAKWSSSGTREYGALKRGALDLKMVLTKITR